MNIVYVPVGVLILLVAFMAWLVEYGYRLTKSTTLIGEVVNVGYNWSRNGNGGFTMIAEIGRVKCKVQVIVSGNSTNLDMQSPFIQDLVGHRIMVTGRVHKTRYGNQIVADSLREVR
jgi:hypothetical protein